MSSDLTEILLHVLWPNRDPSSCLTMILFFFSLLLLYLSFSFFLGLWAFMVLLSFMNWVFFFLLRPMVFLYDPWNGLSYEILVLNSMQLMNTTQIQDPLSIHA